MPLWSWLRTLATKGFVWKGWWEDRYVGSGWSFSVDNIVIKITAVHRLSVLSGCVEAGGTHSFFHPRFAHRIGLQLGNLSITERLSITFAVSRYLSHGPFIPSPTLPQQPPVFHVPMHIPPNRTHPSICCLFHPSSPLARRCLGLRLVHPSPPPLSYMLQPCLFICLVSPLVSFYLASCSC